MRRLALVLGLTVAACGSGNVEGDPDTGGGGRRDGGSGGPDGGDIVLVSPDGGSGSRDGGWVDPCSAEAKLVYVVDVDDTFSSFDPMALKSGGNAFKDLGKLACPAGSATPFSMSVDRSATAWVLYNDGHLFKVRISDLSCTATSLVPQPSLKLFGMGFVSNAAGSQDETLFIAGAPTPGGGTSSFARLALAPSFTITPIGTVNGSPELTGTGDAKLWAFSPDLTPPKVAEIDKSSGAELTTFTAPAIAGDPNAWAFAFWGGDFYIFLRRSTDSSTRVHRMSSKTGALDTPLSSTGRTIVGAGVSTCAPVQIN